MERPPPGNRAVAALGRYAVPASTRRFHDAISALMNARMRKRARRSAVLATLPHLVDQPDRRARYRRSALALMPPARRNCSIDGEDIGGGIGTSAHRWTLIGGCLSSQGVNLPISGALRDAIHLIGNRLLDVLRMRAR